VDRVLNDPEPAMVARLLHELGERSGLGDEGRS
jgi:hypothetical protein